MSFQIDYKNVSKNVSLELTTESIGCFSVDSDWQYKHDLSQLKYYSPPMNPNNVNYDLDKGFAPNCLHLSLFKSNAFEKLSNILKWILDNITQLERPLSCQERWLDADFICRRGLLKKLLCSPYEKKDGWIICASKYHDTIYLCDFYTDEKEAQCANVTIEDKRFMSHGYKFEQYMVTDDPSHKPDPSVSLNEYGQFYCMFKAKFGSHSLLYAAEIDAIDSRKRITDININKKVEFIELKTITMQRQNSNLYGKLFAPRVITWWSQNYLAKIDKIICGLKEGGTVKLIKEYPTDNLPQLSKVDCNVDKCKIFCKLFLDNIKKIITEDYKKCIYKFCWNPTAEDIVHYSKIAPNHEKYSFLKPWFIEKVEEHRNTLHTT